MKRVIALSCLAAVLLAGCGKNESGGSSGKKTETATAAETTAAETTAEATTAEVTTETETTTEPENSASAGDRETMYPETYKNMIQDKYDMLADYQTGEIRVSYALYDMDADGVPELVLSYDEEYMGEKIEGNLGMYTCDENGEAQEVGYFGPDPAAWGCTSDAGDLALIYEMDDYIAIHHFVLSDGSVGIDDSVEFDRDENTVTKDVMAEGGCKYLPYVSIVGKGDDIKSSYIDPNTGKTEEKDGFGFEFFGREA